MSFTDRRVLTLHAPLGKAVANVVLDDVRQALMRHGATSVWIGTDSLPDLVIFARVPDVVPEKEES